MSLDKAALSHRKSASARTFYDRCGAQGHDKSDTCVTHYEVTQTVTTFRIQPYIMTTAQFSPITTQAVQLMQLVIALFYWLASQEGLCSME